VQDRLPFGLALSRNRAAPTMYFRSQQIAQKKVTGKIFPLPLLFG
jgi:hypothetical protein